MMGQYRKKPVVIEARQYDGDSVMNREIIDWTRGSSTRAFMDTAIVGTVGIDDVAIPVLKIQTLEGDFIVRPKDWVIRGVKGEFYPCKPDIFSATYEAV